MIVGKKVILTALTSDSISKILCWVNNPKIKLMTGTIYPISEFEHRDWIIEKARSKNNKLFIIQDKETKLEIGTIGIKNTDYINRNAELYISIGEQKYCGKGFGTDAVKTFVNFCFLSLNMHKVYLRVFCFNTAAIRSYEKAGFFTEGILKDHHYINGKYNDVLIMSIINSKS